MKKKIISLTLATLMVVSTITGCGNDTPKNETTNNETNVETNTETSTPDTNVSDNENGASNETESTTTYDYYTTYVFPDGVEGYTHKYTNDTRPDWSVNYTHFVDGDGFVMDFKWEGPLHLGASVAPSTDNSTIYLETSDDSYSLYGWHDSLDDEADWLKNNNKEDIISWVSSVSYKENGLFETKETTNGYKVIFEVYNDGYSGYACFMDNYETSEAYSFVYLENNNLYDSAKALSVINSIEFSEVEPLEIK